MGVASRLHSTGFSMTVSPASSRRIPGGTQTVAPPPARRGQLALAFQEVLTATVRLRSNRQVAADADSFRAHVTRLLGIAEQEALRAGYAGDDVRLATYAVVAFLDESVLNSAQPMFAEWPRRPLQDELFGGNVAGEIFFRQLRELLARPDTEDVADVLEVYQLCLLLGFRGRYSMADAGDLSAFVARTGEKIGRVRGPFHEISPWWAPPAGTLGPPPRDPWLPRLAATAVAAVALASLLFVGFRTTLDRGVANVQAAAAASTR
jgi:type VI secretion system protein ImpK